MQLINVKKYLIVLLVMGIWHSGFCQIEKITESKKDDFTANYYRKKTPGDTVFIVFDTNQERLEISKKEKKIYSYRFLYRLYAKTYPPPANSCIMLRYYHEAAPPFGHEEFLIEKSTVNPQKVIFESETEFTFWFQNELELFEKTLILVESKDWFNKKKKVKGIGVQISTFGSCDDVIDLTEQESEPE